MIDHGAIRKYDAFVRDRRPSALDTLDVRVGLFGRARVVRTSREEPPHDDEYDVVVAGGGPAGMLYGHMLAERGHSVLILERNRELGAGVAWNLSREEYSDLARTGAFTDEELTGMVTGDYDEGIFRLLDRRGPEPELKDYHFNEVCNISVDEARFFGSLASRTGADVRLGCSAFLQRLTRRYAYVSCRGPEGIRAARCRLFIDARGWTSPLAMLVRPKREMESVFNIVGVRTGMLPRETSQSGKPIGLISATYEDEIATGAGLVQPVLMRFSDYVPGGSNDGELLYYYTRTARPTELHPLVDDMLPRLHQVATGFQEDGVVRTYYGHIPGYYADRPFSPWTTRTSAGDRTLLVGCAGQQYSGLTGCAFGALSRNAKTICDAIDEALRADDLSFGRLRRIDIDRRERVCQDVEELFGGAMELDPYEAPGTVNRDWILFNEVAQEIDPALRNEVFRDKIRLKTLNQWARICARDHRAVAVLLRNNRGRAGMIAWVFLAAYLRLLAFELGLLASRRRKKYVAGSAGALVRMPQYLARSARLYAKGCRLDHRKMRSRKGGKQWGS